MSKDTKKKGDKEFYFFRHTSELHKKDLKFLLKHKSQGMGIYYLILEHILIGQFKHDRHEILNSMELFTNESDFNEVVDYLIETGLLYTKDDNSLQSTLLDAEVHKQKMTKEKSRRTGLAPRIIKMLTDKGVQYVADKYKDELANNYDNFLKADLSSKSEEDIKNMAFKLADIVVSYKSN